MSLLHQARFFITVNHLRDLPATAVPEVAFAGRSNAGKSTAINILCNQKRLAFSSKTPGRTQHINYFSVMPAKAEDPLGFLVDLPGYGYAEAPGETKSHWVHLLGDYVQARQQLAGLVIMMDARRPFTDLDCQMVEWFLPTGKPIHVLLTKADKLTNNEIGWKSEFFGHRLQWNGALYRENWNNVQVAFFDPGLVGNIFYNTNGQNFLIKGVETSLSAPLGMVSWWEAPSVELEMAPGETLLLFTDGLLRRTGRPIDRAFALVQAAAVGAPRSVRRDPDLLVDHVLHCCLPDGAGARREEDVVLLAARFDET